MFPGHVWDFDDACVAFERWLDELGGEISEEVDASTLLDAGGEEVALRFSELVVRFSSPKTVLVVALDVDRSLEPTYYKFDFRHQDGQLIWRYDMHQGHEWEHGGPSHVHERSEDVRLATEPITLEDIRDRLVMFNASGR